MSWDDVDVNVASDEQKRANCLLHWLSDGLLASTRFDEFKPHMIEVVRSGGAEVHDKVWHAILAGKLQLSSKDIAELPYDFVRHVLKKYGSCHQGFVDNDDDEEEDSSDSAEPSRTNRVPMAHAERFFVSLLAADAHHELAPDLGKVLLAYMVACNPRLRVMPMNVTKFDGELVRQLCDFYDDAKRSGALPPGINTRTNVGVIVGNETHRFFEFRRALGEGRHMYYTNVIAIEFPYMCYGFVERVEVDVVKREKADENGGDAMTAVGGDEYIIVPFKPCVEKDHCRLIGPSTKVVTLHSGKMRDPWSPKTYVGIHLKSRFYDVVDIRVYGTALSLVYTGGGIKVAHASRPPSLA